VSKKLFSSKTTFIFLCLLACTLPFLNHIYALPKLGKSTDLVYDSKKDSLVTPTVQDIKKEIILTGQIDAENIAVLKFKTSGRLAWVGVKVGDYVKKGQALASLDKTELKKELDRELNDYLTGLHNFNDVQDEYKETKERFLLTDEIRRILDRAQYTLNNVVIDYELDDLAIKYATLTTPIAGIVTDIEEPFAGVNITAATAEITVIDPESLYFGAQIDEEDVVKVKTDQSALISIDSLPDKTFNSAINYISFLPLSGQSSTVYDIRFKLKLDNLPLTYRLGMNGDAHIILAQKNQVLTLPLEAINQQDENSYVLVKKDKDQVEQKVVKTGIESDTYIEILEGIDQNDQIVIKKR